MKRRKKDIVFIINPSLWYQNMYPSGILCLSGYLENNGFKNTIIDSQISPQRILSSQREAAIFRKIKQIKPKLICFSASHREFNEVIRINQNIKKYNNKIITIVGGPQPTFRGEDFLKSGFDFICFGEGEKTLTEFAKEIFKKNPGFARIKGLGWKKKDKNIFNPPRELLTEAEINSVSRPPYEKIDPRFFEMDIATIRGLPVKGALLLTARGCPFSCSFCGCNLIFGKKLRFKSLKNIEKEVSYLKKHFKIEAVWLIDDTFTINKKHALAVAQILKKHQLIFNCQVRADTLDERLVKDLREAGCFQMDIGVESGSQRILDKIINKGTTINQIKNAFRLAKKYRIRTLANFMIGLPTETKNDLKKTEKLADEINADVYLFAIATPLPGTRFYEMVGEEISADEYGLLDWNGSPLTKRLNKSKIKNLVQEKERLRKKYLLRTLKKSFFSWENLKFFLKRKYKYQRLKFVLNYLPKLTKKHFQEK
ncbi:MAG: B12-binding domain-containing radical SAM protein [Candidatus Pacebacteria bacterium]|nr:B12-binding domain-containing radical SAM protein [Candidatus Paceibacterota bacterium]